MKKNILILIIMILLFTGCNKDEMSKVNNDNEVKVQDNVIDDNKVQSITDNEEEVLDDNINEPIVEQVEEVTTTTTTTTKKVTTRKTTKKATTSKVTTTVKSETTTKKVLEETETTTTKKAEEEATRFYVPVTAGYYFHIEDGKSKVFPYSVFFYGSGSVFSTGKGKIHGVRNNKGCKLEKDKDNPDVVFVDVIISHETLSKKKIFSFYHCVKDPVFKLGDEVTENTVIGSFGQRASLSGEAVSSFEFSLKSAPVWKGATINPRNYIMFPSGYRGYINRRY